MPPSSTPFRRKTLADVKHQSSTHPGLWMDKFLLDDADGAKSKLVRELCDITLPAGYREAFALRRASFEGLADTGNALLFEASATGRLVVGLGAKGVLEAGLTLDHTWGVPYLPGSSLKGLAAAAAHQLVAGEAWQKNLNGLPRERTSYDLLFGTTEDAGAVIFHDAWLIPETGRDTLPLHPDVMTVHHPEYYQAQQNPLPPTDFDSPTPVPFVSVSGKYLLVLEGPEPWCRAAWTLLEMGLRELGLGAKTSSGYGRMTLTERPTEGQQRRKAMLEELRRLPEARHLPQQASDRLTKLLAAQQAGLAEADVAVCLEALYKLEPRFWRGWLKEGKGTAEQRALFEPLLTRQAAEQPAVQPHQPPAAPPPAAPAPANEQPAVAWIALDKSKRPTLYVLLPGAKKPLEEEVRKLKSPLPAEVQAALQDKASSPVTVLVTLKDGKRVLSVRLG